MSRIASILTRVPANLPTSVAEYIENEMCDGRLLPGQRVPEADIAEALSISRTPVREALRILDAQGVLRGVRGVGFVVRGLTLHELECLYDVRALLEPRAAAAAAESAAEDDLWRLGELLARANPKPLAPQDDPGVLGKEHAATAASRNVDFHKMIAQASNNGFLESFIGQLTARPLQHRAMYWYTAAERDQAHREHEQIFDAIQRRSPDEASELMRAHTVRTGEFMVRVLSAHPDSLDH